jgi:GNAT superfamily N-acetyltransferase
MKIRFAERRDVPAILELIRGLAEYEKEPDEVVNTEAALEADLFDRNLCDAFVAENAAGIVGFALYYTSYSTWKGPCVYLEDLYVLPECREGGVGSALFDAVVEVARARKVARMDWQVLDWNTPAIEFYQRKGATLDPSWVNGRLFFRENEVK